jgi:DNA polymerase-3 subunit delta'
MRMPPLLHNRTRDRIEAITPQTVSNYIFHGARSTGKATTGKWLSARLNCPVLGEDDCAICRQVEAGNYPDLLIIAPTDKPSVTIDQIRKLNTALSFSPYLAGGIRMVLIDQAETLTAEAQNALLKMIEEPPPQTHFILVTDAIEALLPTVQSRLANIYFSPVSEDEIAGFLERQLKLKPVETHNLARLANGSVGEAIRLGSQADLAKARTELDRTTTQLLHPNRFTRLIAARRLADNKQPLSELLRLLQQRVITDMTEGQTVEEIHRQITAIVSARRLSSAGVVNRVVLDRLAVEL